MGKYKFFQTKRDTWQVGVCGTDKPDDVVFSVE